MPFNIIRQDITLLDVDAIVNAANEHLKQGGGVCGAIFAAAGAHDLQRACDEIGHVDTGSAVITPGFALPARHVIHTAGPIWHGTQRDRELLASCYRTSLELARDNGLTSVAFPLISSGIYGCPKDTALVIAISAIRSFLADDETDMEVTLVLFGHGESLLGKELFGRLESFIDDAYVDEQHHLYGRNRRSNLAEPWLAECGSVEMMVSVNAAEKPENLTQKLASLDASFPATLLALIDERGLTDAEVYKRANLSRQYFSRLRANTVNPSKRVVLALAVALRLNLEQTRMLLERAGYALSHSYKLDVIVEFFISQGVYDIFTINQALYAYDQQLLGT